MKACVNKENCIGCGVCTVVCPKVFSMDDDGLAKATSEEIEDSIIQEVEDAASQCPVSAIELE